MLELQNKVSFTYDGVDEAFPPCDPGIKPFGSRVLVQIRTPKTKTAGGIILTAEARDTEGWNTQAAKVIAMGPLAFHNRNTMQPWPEGNWCEPGQFVRVPKYGGDRWTVKVPDRDEDALFVIFNDLDIIGLIADADAALKMKAFI